MNYYTASTKQLVEAYAFEAGRINEHDRKTTRNLIRNELERRWELFINSLDDEQTAENPNGTYRILTGEWRTK